MDEANQELEAIRQQYYAEVSHTLNSLLTDANPAERQALYHALEWLGVAEIRGASESLTPENQCFLTPTTITEDLEDDHTDRL